MKAMPPFPGRWLPSVAKVERIFILTGRRLQLTLARLQAKNAEANRVSIELLRARRSSYLAALQLGSGVGRAQLARARYLV